MSPRVSSSTVNTDGSPPHFAAAPVTRRERYATLDVLRGFALLGILAVNIESFAGPESLHDIPMGMAKAAFVGWHANLDVAILTFKWLFIEGKMRAMFAMLFGAGCVLLTERFERRGQADRAGDIYLRRNMWLALFGIIHGTLIWEGDILLDYGLCGLLFLYPLRHVRPSRLIGIGMALAVIGGSLGLANFQNAPTALQTDQVLNEATAAQVAGRPLSEEQKTALDAADKAKREEPARIAAHVREGKAPYLDEIPGRADGYFGFVVALFRTGWMLEIIGAMMLGMGLYRSGYLTGACSARTYMKVAAIGYSISMPIVLVGISHANAAGFSHGAVLRWMYLPYNTQQMAGMIGNASMLLLIVRLGWLKPITGKLAAVGQTAFSSYIMTSLICQFLFAWSPLKLYGSLEYYEELYVVAGIWALNILASTLWLKVFAYGPLEWVWRSLTYWKRQPLLIRKQTGVAAKHALA